MSGPLSDQDLELFFAAARAVSAKPSEDFLAQVEKEALRFCPSKPKPAWRLFFERLFSQKPGWVFPGAATGVLSSVAAAFLLLQSPSASSNEFEHDVLAMYQLGRIAQR